MISVIPKIIILDGAVLKARRVLRARLVPLGYDVLPRTHRGQLPDVVIERYVREKGAVVVTTDRFLAFKTNGIYLDPEEVGKMNSRELATHIIKLISKKFT